jgi:hypothetical protein
LSAYEECDALAASGNGIALSEKVFQSMAGLLRQKQQVTVKRETRQYQQIR